MEGLYFSVSSLSTAGMVNIPSDSPDWAYAIIGLFAATGIPVMGIVMGRIAAYIVKKNHDMRLTRAIAAKSSVLERNVIDALAIDDTQKSLTKHEFLVLTLVRVGLVDINVIGRIYDRFDELDGDGDGLLSYAEVFEEGTAAEGYEKLDLTKNILHKQSSSTSISNSDTNSTSGDGSKGAESSPRSRPGPAASPTPRRPSPRRIYIKPKAAASSSSSSPRQAAANATFDV
jgi:hypothetical protein